MQTYVNNIVIALIFFPFIAAALTIPYMVYQYRKFGSIPWWRTLLVFLFIFYLICAYFLVILPLPADRSAIVAYAQYPQLIPFHFIAEFVGQSGFMATNLATWLPALASPVIYEAVFNIILLVPLGMFLRYYFKRTWWQTLLIGFSVTLFFEISQITGLFGIYAHPYRLFDVDDLILNTFGAMLGYWMMGPALRLLPSISMLNHEAREQGMRISFARRALSFLIDLVFVGIGAALLDVAGSLIGFSPSSVQFDGLLITDAASLVMFIMLFMIVPIPLHGQTLGQKILKLVIVRPDAHPARWYQYFTRYGALYALLSSPFWLIGSLRHLESATGTLGSSLTHALEIVDPFLTVFVVGALVVWLISLPLRDHKAKRDGSLFVMLNELISNTRILTVTGANNLRERAIVLDVSDVVALEKAIEAQGTSLDELMERAGKSVSAAIEDRFDEPVPVAVFCGSGNNGGDGWVAALDLAEKGFSVSLFTSRLPNQISAEPAKTAATEAFSRSREQNLPLRIIVSPDDSIIADELQETQAIVDAILGIGFSGGMVKDPYASWIEAINQQRSDNDEIYVVAVDVPSGLSAQSGKAAPVCIAADMTVTMLVYKPGLLVPAAKRYCGDIKLGTIADVNEYLHAR